MTTSASPPGQENPPVPRAGKNLTGKQWLVVGAMGATLFVLVAATVLVLWLSGRPAAGVSIAPPPSASAATATPTPTPTATPARPIYVPDAVPTPEGLYWPPEPQLLSMPNAPGDLIWWDARFLYRQPILLDVVAQEAPAGTWAQLLFDGRDQQRAGQMRDDGADLRVVIWDGRNWWEIPRRAQPRHDKRGWQILFHIQSPEIAAQGGYYLYYGNPFAAPPPAAIDAPENSRLLLTLGQQESVEWGPEITWSAHATATQTLVSPDGRIVIECPPGALDKNVRVRLRTAPFSESDHNRPLPDFELHVDPPPHPTDWSNVVRWSPPLRVIINWAGLAVDVRDLRGRIHFEYDMNSGAWYSVPIEFDERTGQTRLTTEQP